MVRMEAYDHAISSSSEEEREDKDGIGSQRIIYQTPFKVPITRAATTPATVTEMTPSPMSFSRSVSSNPGTAPVRALERTSHESFLAVQHGFLENRDIATNLFHETPPFQTRRKRRSFPANRSRLSQSLLLDGYSSPMLSRGTERRRLTILQKPKALGITPNSEKLSRDKSLVEVAHKGSPDRGLRPNPRMLYSTKLERLYLLAVKQRGRNMLFLWGFIALSLTCSVEMVLLTLSAAQRAQVHDLSRPDTPHSVAGLRGQMTSGHWEERHNHVSQRRVQTETKKSEDRPKEKPAVSHHKHSHQDQSTNVKVKAKHIPTHDAGAHQSSPAGEEKHSLAKRSTLSAFPMIHLPPLASLPTKPKFDIQDSNMYTTHSSTNRRVVALDPFFRAASAGPPRSIKHYPADFTDNTQLYSILDSSDERLGHMERREPYSEGECVPMQDWQTTFHPSCNGMHEIAIENMGEDNGNHFNLFGTKGFWRYAWRLDVQNVHEQDTLVLKTLKFNHNFEDAHFEHDRIDAVAMERLTRSPHVINVFGFCGHSVLTEFADGPRVGEVADKSKRTALARLRFARDIAHGLADVHGIDGEGNATFVHLDVNLANVVSINGTLKLNDFNIGIIRRWNTTSNTPCGFPAQYPNPQWRSPEEARNEQNLTEKVDVFSMGHIFFRLICGHEPWNKLEPGGRPSKEEVNLKVQRGDLPFIPDFVHSAEDPEIIAIRDAMLSCYTFDPTKRPSARDVANGLDKALEALAKQL